MKTRYLSLKNQLGGAPLSEEVKERFSKFTDKTPPHEVLGLELKRSYSDDEIKKQYRYWSLKVHPDRHKEDTDEATRYFKLVNNANEYLQEHKKRYQPPGDSGTQSPSRGHPSTGRAGRSNGPSAGFGFGFGYDSDSDQSEPDVDPEEARRHAKEMAMYGLIDRLTGLLDGPKWRQPQARFLTDYYLAIGERAEVIEEAIVKNESEYWWAIFNQIYENSDLDEEDSVKALIEIITNFRAIFKPELKDKVIPREKWSKWDSLEPFAMKFYNLSKLPSDELKPTYLTKDDRLSIEQFLSLIVYQQLDEYITYVAGSKYPFEMSDLYFNLFEIVPIGQLADFELISKEDLEEQLGENYEELKKDSTTLISLYSVISEYQVVLEYSRGPFSSGDKIDLNDRDDDYLQSGEEEEQEEDEEEEDEDEDGGTP